MRTFELLAIGHRNPDPFSWIIQYGQSKKAGRKIDFSHLAILVDGVTVFHATEKGFHEQSLQSLLDEGGVIIRRRITIPVKRACCALMWLRRAKGIKYSLWQYGGFLFPKLRWLFATGRKATVCCEIVADFLVDLCELVDDLLEDPDWLMPYEVLEIAEKHF